MKTNKEESAQTTTQDSAQPPSELNHLIRRPRTPHATYLPEKVDGIAIGTLSALPDNGDVLVNIDDFGLQNIAAQSLMELDHTHLAQQVALGFQAGNPYRPIVLGLLHHSTPVVKVIDDSPRNQELEITQQGNRIIIEAEQELELRCGEAVILLTADGHIQLRGGYITSHADATQRIRGGSVQIN